MILQVSTITSFTILLDIKYDILNKLEEIYFYTTV
jgi:hypothetical protein